MTKWATPTKVSIKLLKRPKTQFEAPRPTKLECRYGFNAGAPQIQVRGQNSLGYPWLYEKFCTHPLKLNKFLAHFLKGQPTYPLQNQDRFSMLTSTLQSFSHKSNPCNWTPDLRLWTQTSSTTKMGRAYNAKSQLSRVPWPGNCWMLFTEMTLESATSPIKVTCSPPKHTHQHTFQLPPWEKLM